MGMRVNLWQVGRNARPGWPRFALPILKDILVTVTEIKTGTPGNISGKKASFQSLRGMGDDGIVYEKHWDHWPENIGESCVDSWTARADGAYEETFWTPKEATYVYNVSRTFKDDGVSLIGDHGRILMRPRGHINYCKTHDEYWPGGLCFSCQSQSRKQVA